MMDGIMSSPSHASLHEEARALKREAFGDITDQELNRQPLTPESSPSRKRHKKNEPSLASSPLQSPGKVGKPSVVKNLNAVFAKSLTVALLKQKLGPQMPGAYDPFAYKYWKNYYKESRAFCSGDGDVDYLSQLAPEANVPPESLQPFSVAAFHNSNKMVTGMQGGHVCISGFTDPGVERRSRPHYLTRYVHTDAVLDIDLSCSDRLFATTSGDGRAKVCDLVSQNAIAERQAAQPFKQAKFHPNNERLVALSSKDGSIKMFDWRLSEREDRMAWNNAHAIPFDRSQKKQSNKGGYDNSVTSLVWVSENMIATASASNTLVRLWDIRKTRAHCALTAETPAPKHQPRRFGTVSLAFDWEDHKLWCLSRDNHIYSFSPSRPTAGYLDDLYSPDVQINSFYPRLTVLNSGAYNSGSYIACGGGIDNSVVVFSKPSHNMHLSGVKEYDPKDIVLLKHGHKAPVTGVAAHSASGRLISIADDSTVRYWGVDHQKAKTLREKQYPLSGWSDL
ncbi:hypothetical protein TRVA0_001S06766 [Trichomonascus vanleenenianus]|uniref:uncharacterized protein n=1 Tax=Trichomonascus vanleenenianus TaxID=2268995 RepID=UPI003ECB097D